MTKAHAVLVLIMALVFGGGVMPAFGQRALGDGRALDDNPRVGSGGRNTARASFQAELDFRNAIATGNAPGGLSFRGDLGYRAPGEFAGNLGSDALFAFRRDSLYSGLAGMGIRGTEALQYQFSVTTGSRITGALSGRGSVTRLGLTTSADAADQSGALSAQYGSAYGVGQDLRLVTGSLRSTSTHRSSGTLNPELLSVYEEGLARDTYGVISSPLLGLTSTPMAPGMNTRRGQEDAMKDLRVKTSYDDLVAVVRERAKSLAEQDRGADEAGDEGGDDTEQTDEWVLERFIELHNQIHGIEGEVEGEQGSGDESDLELPGLMFDEEEAGSEETTIELNPKTLALIETARGRVDTLIPPDADPDNLYAEHVRAGQRLLISGRYFDAEERFIRALGLRNGDVSAQIGRLHAQIGAGLVVSGALNLRTLLTERPLLMAQRYGGGLIPPADRCDAIILNLRDRIGIGRDLSGTGRVPEPADVRLSCALLLAYMGYQVDRPEQIRDALGVVEEIGEPTDLRLASVLRTVWLGAGADGGEDEGEGGGVDP